MKKLVYSKKIKQETAAFCQLIEAYCEKINKEYSKNINKILQKIAEGENLDFELLKKKYLNQDIVINDSNTFEDDTILEKEVIDGTAYYYEKTDNGKVYDSHSNVVGVYKNNKIIIKD
jgi:hypothetical protein